VIAAAVVGLPIQHLVQFERLALTTVSHASLIAGSLPMFLSVAAAIFSGRTWRGA